LDDFLLFHTFRSMLQASPKLHKERTLSRRLRARSYAFGRWLRRHQTAIFCSVLIPLCLFLTAFGIVYLHYARIIDRHMEGGPFADAVNIYGAPFVITEGDPLSSEDLRSELKMIGYREGDGSQPGTFQFSGSSVVVAPNDGPSVRIAADEKQIRSIEINGHRETSWAAGAPLLANLSASREKRQLVTFDQIPKVLVEAVSSAEDKHFFTHEGLDVPRIVKAAWVDFRSHRKEQGASTLTMQLVRDLYLQPDKRWKRKISEAMMTIHLERKWSKPKIFETYANEVYLGRQAAYSIHGFAEGAELFFGKHLSDITLPEAATLAGMVQRPSYFNPYRNPNATTERRNLVLSLMRTNRYITDSEYEDAVSTPLKLTGPQIKEDPYNTSYFLDLVTDDLEQTERDEGASAGVNSTIDLNLQQAASEAVQAGIAEVDKQLASKYAKTGVKAEAALIALDPHTGEIRAVVGGRDYARSQLNRVLAKRPPGSVFKPFVYAAAMNTAVEGGNKIFTPASLVDDSATTFWVGKKAYTPANFKKESFGTLTFRQALAHSDNIAAVKVAQMVGYDNVVAMARRAGLNGDIKPTPSVALGTYVVSPLEMAGAYTTFANGGMWVKPHILETEQADARQAMDPRVAYLLVSMMEEVLRSGTAASVRSRGFTLPAAGKTGTSHDGWFAGFTSRLLCVVWVGFDNYDELNLEGAKSALPIWTEFMKRASRFGRYRDAQEFPSPGGIDTAKICMRSGKLAGPYCVNTRSEVFISGTEPQEPCDIDVPGLPVSTTSDRGALLVPAVASVSGDSANNPGYSTSNSPSAPEKIPSPSLTQTTDRSDTWTRPQAPASADRPRSVPADQQSNGNSSPR
jgi:penicillin-binding protein 1B